MTMFGDVRQIDPPEGIALYTVPQPFLTRPPSTALTPLAAQGLELLWGQGVELIEFLEQGPLVAAGEGGRAQGSAGVRQDIKWQSVGGSG